MDTILSELIDFVVNSPNETFFDENSGIYTIFDKLNLVDFYIFNYFIHHKDFWYSNYFIVRNTAPSMFFLVPWDFDKCLGQFAWNLHDSDNNPELSIREDNKLFNRLLGNSEFMACCSSRWLELRETLWTEEFILDMVSEIYDSIEEILDIETEKWNPGDLREEWYNDVDVSVKNLFTWISERLIFCDSYFLNYASEI